MFYSVKAKACACEVVFAILGLYWRKKLEIHINEIKIISKHTKSNFFIEDEAVSRWEVLLRLGM